MSKKRKAHNEYQRDIFATEFSNFCAPIADEVRQRLQRIVAETQLAKDERVLDVGTGTGVLVPYIRNCGVEYIVGCDLSPAMLTVARQRHQNVIFWGGDVVDLPADLGPFDVVFLNAVFGNVWDQAQLLLKVSELLRKAGRVCISHPLGSRFVADLHRADPRRTPDTLPNRDRWLEMVQQLPVKLVHYEDEPDFYLTILRQD